MVELLKNVLANPRTGLYIKRLVVIGCEEDDADYLLRSTENRPFSSDDMELFQTVASSFPVLSSPEYETGDRSWHQELASSNELAVLGLLMLHCPNLSFLDLEYCGADCNLIFELIGNIAATKDCELLTQLKRVRYRHLEWQQSWDRTDINDIKLLLALPSLESIDAGDLSMIDYGGQVGDPLPLRSSHVQALSFARCPITKKSMCELLEATKQLKSFSIYETPLDPWWLRTSLLATARDSLEFLSLRRLGMGEKDAYPAPNNSYLGKNDPYIGTLKAFTALHTIEIDQDMLANPEVFVRLRQFGNKLPSRLRSLTIWVNGRPLYEAIEAGFLSLVHAGVGQTMLPNLQKISLLDYPKNLTGEQMKALETIKLGFTAQKIAFHY